MSEYHPALYPYSSDPTSQPYPHGVYPYAPPMSSYLVNGGLQMPYPVGAQGSQTWVTDQAIQPVTENHPHALQMGHTAYPSMFKGPVKEKRKHKKKRKLNHGNLNQAVRCELCDISCNSIVLYEMHLAGKKHFKTLQKKYASSAALPLPTSQPVVNGSSSVPTSSMVGNSIQGAPSGPIVEDLGRKKQKLVDGGAANSVRLCSACNVLCNSEKTFATHCAGKRHLKQVRNVDSGVAVAEGSFAGKEHATEMASASGHGIGGASLVFDPKGLDATNEKIPESGVVVESKNACMSIDDQCKNDVPSLDDIVEQDNITQEPENSTVSGHDCGGDSGVADGLDLGYKGTKLVRAEATEKFARLCATCNIVCNSEVTFAAHVAGKKHATQVLKASAGTENPEGDSEENGQKVEGSGLPSTTAIVCDVCKVVCNSDTVMNTHLTGKKHASMVKKLAGTSMPVSTTT